VLEARGFTALSESKIVTLEVARIVADRLLCGPVDVYTPRNGRERSLEHGRRFGSKG
jgi:hypothetical protein